MKQGWEIKKLGEVFDLQMGKTPSRDNGDYWGGNNVWVAISDLQDKYIGESKEHITDKALTETKIKKVKAGTTIMSFKLSVGRAAITTQDLYTNEAIMAFNLNEGYDLIADYIYYYLKGYKWQGANKAVMGLTLNKASISQNHIAIPPREEQERIVEELDCLSGVIEKKREQLRELDALAQSIFYQMFGDPITNEKGWEVKTFGDCYKLASGNGLSAKDIIEGVYPVYGGNGILGFHHEYNLDGNNIIIGRVGALCGNVRNVVGKAFITDNAFILTKKIENDNTYLLHLLQVHNLRKYAREAMQPVVSNAGLKNIEIIIPPLTLQQEFADKIALIEKQKELIKQSITETEELFNSRMDYYFN